MMLDIFAVGTAPSIQIYKSSLLKLRDKITLAWSSSFLFFAQELGYYPTFWSFMDPHSAIASFNHILSLTKPIHTKILVPAPVLTDSYETQLKYSGTTCLFPKYLSLQKKSDAWNELYLQRLHAVKKSGLATVQYMPTTTIKKLVCQYNQSKSKSLPMYDYDGKDAWHRFLSHALVMMGSQLNNRKPDEHNKYMNLYENKYTMCVLPICYHLCASNVYTVGFDGKGGRYFDNNYVRGLQDMSSTYHLTLPKWVAWEPLHKMRLYSVVESQHTILNQYLRYKAFSDAI